MMVCVLSNTLVLALDHYGISDDMEEVLNTLNFTFTIVFVVEMAVKLAGLGVVTYCKDNMNVFDGIVVLLSIVEMAYF